MRQARSHFQQLQQQAQSPNCAIVCWDRFLAQQQLQVLLVEDDDATRHVVSALLRNCSYEVTPAASGLVAWELLMDKATQVDLVLTEVVLPCLSGIGLLGRIMNHRALKHIPVIMMSSHDSVNVVFKCLSKGAVDFLVKPLRRNELKNLWQHVWRRRRVKSSGSSSCSVSQTRRTARPNDVGNPHEFGTNGDMNKASSELNVTAGSDNGSGNQSPWNKGDLEVESPRINELCSNGFRTHLELQPVIELENNCWPAGSEHGKEKGHGLADSNIGPSLGAAANADGSNPLALIHDNLGTAVVVKDTSLTGHHKDDACGFSQGITQREAELLCIIKEQDSNTAWEDTSIDEGDLLAKHTINSHSSKNKLSDSSSAVQINAQMDSANALELSLNQACKEEDLNRERGGRVVIHSYASAFSRYNYRGNLIPSNVRTNPANTSTGHVGFRGHVPVEKGGDGSTSSVFTLQKESIAFLDGGSNDGMARNSLQINTTAQCPAKHMVPSNEDHSVSKVPHSIPLALHLGSSPEAGERCTAKECCVNYKQDESVYLITDSYSQNHHHHHHHHHIQHHYYFFPREKHHLRRLETPQHNNQTVTDVNSGAPKCGSSNMEIGLEGNLGLSGSSHGYRSTGNGAISVNGSATGRNCWSNAIQNAAAVFPIKESCDANDLFEQDTHLPYMSIVTGPNENCIANRGAALTNKFRQKRKERSFETKVCHES